METNTRRTGQRRWIIQYQIYPIAIGKGSDCGGDGESTGINKRWRN